jgi:hypothetical protein
MVIKSRKRNSKLKKKNSRKLMKGGAGNPESGNAESPYISYSGKSNPLEYIKNFLCTKPIEGDEDFDDSKYIGTRCERFLTLLSDRNTFIKKSQHYIDKFGETNGKYIYEYIENNNLNEEGVKEREKNIKNITEHCENNCRRSPVTKNNNNIRKLIKEQPETNTNVTHAPNPQNRPLPAIPEPAPALTSVIEQEENPAYESLEVLQFIKYLQNNKKCEAFKGLHNNNNEITKDAIQKTIFENKQIDINNINIDELMKQLTKKKNIKTIIDDCGGRKVTNPLYEPFNQRHLPYKNITDILENIKVFLCAQPIDGDEDFDSDKYKGTRCERFLQILVKNKKNSKTAITDLDTYITKFGKNNGTYIFAYIKTLSDKSLFIKFIKKKHCLQCNSQTTSINSSTSQTASLNSNTAVNSGEPLYNTVETAISTKKNKQFSTIFNPVYGILDNTNAENAANAKYGVLGPQLTNISDTNLNDSAYNQYPSPSPSPMVPIYASVNRNKSHNLNTLCNNTRIMEKNPTVTIIANNNQNKNQQEIYNTINSTIKLKKLCEKYKTDKEKKNITVKINENPYASVLTFPGATTNSTTNSTINSSKQYENLSVVLPANPNIHMYEEIANTSAELLPIIEYLSEEGNDKRLTIFQKLVNNNTFNNETLTSKNLVFGSDIPKDILEKIKNLGQSEKTYIIENVSNILKKNDDKNALISYLLQPNDSANIEYENMRELTNTNDNKKYNYKRMRINKYNRLDRFKQIFINVCTKKKANESYKENEKCTGLNENAFSSLFKNSIAEKFVTLTEHFDRNEIEQILIECYKKKNKQANKKVETQNKVDANVVPANQVTVNPITIPNTETYGTYSHTNRKFLNNTNPLTNATFNVSANNARSAKHVNMKKAAEAEEQKKAEELKKAEEKKKSATNEAASNTEVKKVVKEELINYLSNTKGSIIDGKNRCERYEDIINSKSKKSKNNFAGKFNNKKTQNLSNKTNYLDKINTNELNEVVTQCKAKREINIKQIKQYLINYLSDSAGSRQNNLNRLQRYETIFANGKIRDKNEYIKSFNLKDVDNIYMATSRLSNDEINDVITKSKANKKKPKVQPDINYLNKRKAYDDLSTILKNLEQELEENYNELDKITKYIDNYKKDKLKLNNIKKTKKKNKNIANFTQKTKSFYNSYEQTLSGFELKKENLEKEIKDFLENIIIPLRKKISKMYHELF